MNMPESTSLTSSLEGSGLLSNSHVMRSAAAGALYALCTTPASIRACCTTVRCMESPRLSGVTISQPSASPARTRFANTGVPSRSTVSLPQKPSASSLSLTAKLPFLRSISRRLFTGSMSIERFLPLIVQLIMTPPPFRSRMQVRHGSHMR